MAFTNFKNIAQVQEAYKVKYEEEEFIQLKEFTPSKAFIEEFEFNQKHMDVFISEASRCENIIYPILREVYKSYVNRYSFWSHKTLSDQQLSGIPDYIISTKSSLGKTVLGLPIMIVIEAKQNNFIEGWGQCLAEMIAASKMNNEPSFFVDGIVTDGEVWQFGRLTGDLFIKHNARFTIDDLKKLFGAIQFVLSRE